MPAGKYPLKIKETMVKRFLENPESKISIFSKENGIPESCLRDWIREAQSGILGSMSKPKHYKYWALSERFKAIIEYENLSEEEKGKWLRKHALKSERIELWKKELTDTLDSINPKKDSKENKKIKALEKELKIKNKALAEASNLLFVKKKADILFGKEEGDE